MAAAAAAAPAPTKARGLPSCRPLPGAPEEAAAAVPTPPRPPPLFAVSECEGRGPNRGEEGAPPPPRLWGRRCGRSRRCCCRCQVSSEEEVVAAAANMFSVRIVTADYYMANPLQGLDICQSPLTQAPVKKVPVVRVFGATPAGKRAGAADARAALPAAHSRARRRPSPQTAAASSLPLALLAFPPEPDERRKNGGPRGRCAPPPASHLRRGGGGRRVFTLRAAVGSRVRTWGRGQAERAPLSPRRTGQVAAPCPP